MILSGSANQHLAHSLADQLEEEVLPLTYRRFADGELIVEVDRDDLLPTNVVVDATSFTIDERVVIVCSTISDQAHLEVIQLQDLAREAGAPSIVTVVPYLGYARQDVAHHPGQPVSARAVIKALTVNTDRFITVDPHEDAVLDYSTADTTSVSAVAALADGLPLDADSPIIIAPDEGAKSLAVSLRDAIGYGEIDFLEKKRIDDTTVEISLTDTDVDGHEVILVDDEVSTGGTMATAASQLLDHGASSVTAACVHPLFIGGAFTRLARAGIDRIVATDTIERPVSQVSVASTIAAEL